MAACPVSVITPPAAPVVMKLTLEAAVVTPREAKVRFAAAPEPTKVTVPAPAVGVRAPKDSVVAAPVKPVNCKLPPALPVVVLALKVIAEALSKMVEAAAFALSFKVPSLMVVAPV